MIGRGKRDRYRKKERKDRAKFSEPKKGGCTETKRARERERERERERGRRKEVERAREIESCKEPKERKGSERKIRKVVPLFGPRGWERVALSRSSPPAAVVMLPALDHLNFFFFFFFFFLTP